MRKGAEVLLGDGDRNLVDPFDHATSLFNIRAVEECREALRRRGSLDLTRAFDMRLSGHSWEEIAGALGYDINARVLNLLSVRLSRSIRWAVS